MNSLRSDQQCDCMMAVAKRTFWELESAIEASDHRPRFYSDSVVTYNEAPACFEQKTQQGDSEADTLSPRLSLCSVTGESTASHSSCDYEDLDDLEDANLQKQLGRNSWADLEDDFELSSWAETVDLDENLPAGPPGSWYASTAHAVQHCAMPGVLVATPHIASVAV